MASWIVHGLDPWAFWFGLNGVIFLAYIIAIPANEIVIPTVLMLTVMLTGNTEYGAGAGVMFETGDEGVRQILTAGGWTALTGVCLMIFSLCHNPCSTTIYTIYKETASWKWTTVSVVLPLMLGFALCAALAAVWRLVA